MDGYHWVTVPQEPWALLHVEHNPNCPHYLFSPGDGHPPYITEFRCQVGRIQRFHGLFTFFRHAGVSTPYMLSALPLEPGRHAIEAGYRHNLTHDIQQGFLKAVTP